MFKRSFDFLVSKNEKNEQKHTFKNTITNQAKNLKWYKFNSVANLALQRAKSNFEAVPLTKAHVVVQTKLQNHNSTKFDVR